MTATNTLLMEALAGAVALTTAQLAMATGRSTKTVFRRLPALVASGAVVGTKGAGRRPNVYRLARSRDKTALAPVPPKADQAEPLAATGTDGPTNTARAYTPAHALDPFHSPTSSLGLNQPTAAVGGEPSDLPGTLGDREINQQSNLEKDPVPLRISGSANRPSPLPSALQTGTRAREDAALEALLDFGLGYGEAADLLARWGATRCLSKLEMVREMIAQRRVEVSENPANYLRRAIERDYRPRLKATPVTPTPAETAPAEPPHDAEAEALWSAAQPAIAAAFSRMNSQIVLRDARLVRLTRTTAILAPRRGMAGGCKYLLEPLGRILSRLAGRPLIVVLERPPPG